MTLALLASVAVCFSACNRGEGAASAQAVTGAIARPGPQGPHASPAQATVATPSTSSVPSSASVPATPNNSGPVKLLAADSSQSFTVADHTFRLLKHVQSIESQSGKAAEETVECWELRNSKDQVVHREQYPFNVVNGAFDFSVAISASSFTTQQGSGIVVERTDEPSDPLSGGSVQVFGFKYGRDKYGVDESLFGSFGPPIWVEGDYLGIGTDTLRPKPTLAGPATMTTMNDILRFKVWTGNFYVIYPVVINWITGRLEPGRRCIETTTKGQTERCSYPVEAETHRDGEATFVRLFPEPDDGFTPKHIIVQPEAQIEFLEARIQIDWVEDVKAISFGVNGDMWLKVRVGNQGGWIHSEEDFEAVGLPQSG